MREIKFRAWDKDKINVRKGSKGMYKQHGYILAKAEYHPHANKRGYVPLHRLLMENELGRYLIPRKELVHHIDGDRENNELQNLKLTTPQEHYIDEHFEKRNPNGRFVANDPAFEGIKYRMFDRDKNITQIYTLKELISKTFRRAKFEFRGRFTGLKDKNGTDIYEGDIVTGYVGHSSGYLRKNFPDKVKVICEVIFDRGMFKTVLIKPIQEHQYAYENGDYRTINYSLKPMFINATYYRPSDGKRVIGDGKTCEYIEVIGSIYENKELLEEVE